jgi:hypothetical protein
MYAIKPYGFAGVGAAQCLRQKSDAAVRSSVFNNFDQGTDLSSRDDFK